MPEILDRVPLLPYNTFGIEATACHWAEFATPSELAALLQHCREHELPWYVLSGGSNIILTGNFPGMILHPIGREITIAEQNDAETLVCAGAGVVWDDLVAWSVERGLGGLENLSWIPGYVGASPVQNIGAYGREAKDAIREVEYFDTEAMTLRRIAAAECRFGYRDSIFKHELRGKAIVTAVTFRLSENPVFDIGYGDLSREVEKLGGPSLANIREAVIAIRQTKLPDPEQTGNAGSFFKNPCVTPETFEVLKAKYPEIPSYPAPAGQVKVPAAWLIDRAGWKGARCGTVGVHPNQALVIINLGGATAQEILTLARRIIADVEHKFGIRLEMEVNVL